MTAALKLLLGTFVLLFSGSNGISISYYEDLENELNTISKEYFVGICYFDLVWALLNEYVTPRCRSPRYYYREQTRGNYKWCVYDNGVPVAHTLEEIKFFSYDCDETIACEENTVYEFSGRCEMTCDQAKLYTEFSISYGCRNKCICPRGWFRNRAGKCVRESECESELYYCPAPKIYAKCATTCPPTCAVPEPDYCTTPCNENLHCVCPWDMVQISKDNRKCVKSDDCPVCERGSVPADCPLACPDTCPDDIVCKKTGCEKGVYCACPPGTVRLDRNLPVRCVEPEQCPPFCESPRVLTKGCGTSCQPTCDDMKPACAENCVEKNTCSCRDGFVQRSQNDKRCIKVADCPAKIECEKPKVPVKCVRTCPKTCDKRRIVCRRDCKEKYVCECPKGHLQISKDNTTCVKEDECPPQCEAPKIFSVCPTTCPLSCKHPKVRACTKGCNEDKCVCPKGKILLDEKTKECVFPKNCPEICEFPRVASKCRTSCEPSCASLSRTDTDVIPQCREQCKFFSGVFCLCGPGYVVGYDGECVKAEDCPPRPLPTESAKCTAPLVPDSCPTLCPPTCQNPEPKACSAGCNEDKCVCPDGKILLNNEKTKICVKPSECPGPCDETHIPIPCPGKCPETCIKDVSFCERDCEADYICGCPGELVQISHVKTKCVRKEECPAPCKAPKRYATCASMCQPTCQNQNPKSCRRGCNPNKCVCPRGMVQPDDNNLTCIKPEECRKDCDAPKVHVECPSKCQLTCENRAPDMRNCKSGCREDSCVCPKLLLLVSETNRTCVKPFQCPTPKVTEPKVVITPKEVQCEGPKVFTKCATKCPPTCMAPKPLICSRACDVNVLCVCPYGMVQRSKKDTTCIKPENCPGEKKVCAKPKIYVDCASKCRPTCQTPNPVFCKNGCDEDVHCVCPPGWVHLTDQDDSCIKLSDCPKSCGFLLKATSCASSCPPTCDNPVPKCDKRCKKDVRCECQLGLLQHSATNTTCLFPSQCPGLPKYCPGRKVPTRCATSCPATCQNKVPGFCKKDCRPDVNCECPGGMVQISLEDDTCIWPGDC